MRARILLFGVLAVFGCNQTPVPQTMTATITRDVPANDPEYMTSVYGAFNQVKTHHDHDHFYVESNGLPQHEMMVGITSWQQQVPIRHDYSGSNSWPIPLRPELAAKPLSTRDNFMRGAIAIAVNGIPIFNPMNNRGEDAKAAGELDRWGGHCGRADDYHYHLPPTHLQAQVGEGKPIAYALDGFPVYGETSEHLDEYLGRFNGNGSYQYHAVKEYPYLIAALRGKVAINPTTQAPENEISPQAKTTAVRPFLRPLRGATITAFESLGPKSYSLTYTLDGETHIINYSWDEVAYTFEFQDPDGTLRTEIYPKK